MKRQLFYALTISIVGSCSKPEQHAEVTTNLKTVLPVLCIEDNSITKQWQAALTSREERQYIDSLSEVKRTLRDQERAWFDLIRSRVISWNRMRDSLEIPFGELEINDSIFVFSGYQGSDDAFTFENQTVCFDLTALNGSYGSATDSINTNRIDRLFAHEYTHLLSKEWMRKHEWKLNNFEDSILWESLYEGLGMYRSMSSMWFPMGKQHSASSAHALSLLVPVFTERLMTIHSATELSMQEKEALHANLSRGSMTQKWGALPVGIWLAMEANGDDEKLRLWVEQGHHAIIPLAMKYLPPRERQQFEHTFGKK